MVDMGSETTLFDLVGTISDEEAEAMLEAIETSRRASIERERASSRKRDDM